MTDFLLPIGQCAALACLLEATAPKPGNVHRGADFDDVTYLDFVTSGIVVAPAIEAAATGDSLGEAVLKAVRATREAVGTNTNLGTLVLMVPLAKVPRDQLLAPGVSRILGELTASDARLVYEAILLARPGGMGQVAADDLSGPPPADLMAAMRSAAGWDMVARQYANGFAEVLGSVVPWLSETHQRGWSLADTIVHVHLRLLAEWGDSLIARKCGAQISNQARARAGAILAMGSPGQDDYDRALSDFDFWLRSDGHRRNPGTTADLVAAGLFAALRDGIIQVPFRFYRPN